MPVRIKYFLYMFLFLLLSGCNKQDKIQTTISPADSIKSSVSKNKIKQDTGISQYEGLYIYNLDVSSFMDCKNPDSSYWVSDKTGKLAEMYKKTLPNPNVYGTVKAIVKGELRETSDETRTEKFPKTLEVNEIVSMEKKNYRNVCVPYDFWGLGNEPGWSLEISQKENLIEFNLPVENKVYYFFYEEPVEENGVITYTSHNEIQRYVIDILIKKEKCSDGMSDRIYDYSVEVNLSGGKKYKGCGIKGK